MTEITRGTQTTPARKQKTNGTPRKPNGDGSYTDASLPEILCGSGDHARATKDALAVLAAEPDPMASVYVRGDLLMRPVRLNKPFEAGGIKRPEGALMLRQVESDWIRLYLGRKARWWKWASAGRGDPKQRPIDPPDTVCRNVLVDAPWPMLPVLTGIIEAPTILPNGRVIQHSGYDRQTGLLFDPGETVFPKIPERPGRIDAMQSLNVLKKPFKDFPFVDEMSRAVAISAVLTILVRRVLRIAPMFAFDAPTRSSGKTLLASCMSLIATGRTPSIMSHIDDPAEERKRLMSLLIEGTPGILIDNVEKQFRSEALNVILTSDTFSDRLLGVNRTVTAATNSMFMASGNNIVIAGDLSTRALLCQIDPGIEDPDSRKFTEAEQDLHAWLPANRGSLVAAALTIIKAYILANPPLPKEIPNYGRFDEWQQMCRYPLVWLDLPDPCKSREKILSEDPDAGNLKSLMMVWSPMFNAESTTLKAAIEKCQEAIDEDRRAKSDEWRDGAPLKTKDISNEESFVEVAKSISLDKGGINFRKLGWFLARNERRVVGGLRFEKDGEFRGTAKWKLAPAGKGQSEGL